MRMTPFSFITCLSLILIYLCIPTDAAGYAWMSCVQDREYVNDWDEYHLDRNMYWLNGQHSIHDNRKEDRRFKWRHCRPCPYKLSYGTDDPHCNLVYNQGYKELEWTDFDEEWTRTCPQDLRDSYRNPYTHNSAMLGGYSIHSDKHEDRIWQWSCGGFNTRYRLRDCQWFNDVNDWDGPVDLECPNNGVIKSVKSRHRNRKEDRIWSFECCRIWDSKCSTDCRGDGELCGNCVDANLYATQESNYKMEMSDNNEESENNDENIWSKLTTSQQIIIICGVVALATLMLGCCVWYTWCRKKKVAPLPVQDADVDVESEEESEQEDIELQPAQLMTTDQST